MLQVLALEYGTLREEILMRLNARYQFVGFVTGAAGLIGVGIGYSSGLKIWLLVALGVAVLALGIYGYFRMQYYGYLVSARIAQIEDRINKLVPVEPGTRSLLSWESEHRAQFFGPFRLRARRLK